MNLQIIAGMAFSWIAGPKLALLSLVSQTFYALVIINLSTA